MHITYVTDDATRPIGVGNKIIAYVCNDIGAWGAGFVLALSRRWPQPRAEYLKEKRLKGLSLGTVGFVHVDPDIWVTNMVAQRDIRSQGGQPPIRYEAFQQCLATVASEAQRLSATVHMPRIGCGLAGGKWEIVAALIAGAIPTAPSARPAPQIQAFVYDLPR